MCPRRDADEEAGARDEAEGEDLWEMLRQTESFWMTSEKVGLEEG